MKVIWLCFVASTWCLWMLISFMLIRLCTRLKALVSRAFNVTVRSRCEGWLLLSMSRLDAHMMPIKANKTNPSTMLEQICCAMADVKTMFKLEVRLSYRCTVLLRDSVFLSFIQQAFIQLFFLIICIIILSALSLPEVSLSRISCYFIIRLQPSFKDIESSNHL